MVCLPELLTCRVEVVLSHSLLGFVVQGNCLSTLKHTKNGICNCSQHLQHIIEMRFANNVSCIKLDVEQVAEL